jgi:hypothetical protein
LKDWREIRGSGRKVRGKKEKVHQKSTACFIVHPHLIVEKRMAKSFQRRHLRWHLTAKRCRPKSTGASHLLVYAQQTPTIFIIYLYLYFLKNELPSFKLVMTNKP